MARLVVLLAALLGVSHAANNFTSVFQWSETIELEWPTRDRWGHSWSDKVIDPKYMAVFGQRLFLSLDEDWSAHVTLVCLPTSHPSTASPKMKAYPSYEANIAGDCNAVQQAQGLEVDAEGRLWVFDRGAERQHNCKPKLWIFDLSDDSVFLSHQFADSDLMLGELVLDQADDDDWLAYMVDILFEKLRVFSLKKKALWRVDTQGVKFYALALSPADEVKKLYLTDYRSGTWYSASLNALRSGSRRVQLSRRGSWNATRCYRMLADANGNIYAAFNDRKSVFSKDSQNNIDPFKEDIFYQDAKDTKKYTFALDTSGYFWVLKKFSYWGHQYELLKFPLGTRSYIHSNVKACPLACNQEHGICLKSGFCHCKPGWWGKNCQDCFAHPGCVHGTCSKPWQCNCDAGWQGMLCDKAVCSEGCSQEHGFCDKPGECHCRDGWQGEKCDQCKPAAGCVQGTCSQPGECKCRTGWTGPLCDKAICSKTCNASHGYCNEPGECRCRVGWQGSDCDVCHPYPGCENGFCDRPWECKCESGWAGIFCDQELTYCEDHDIKCENGGKCVSLSQRDGNFRCETARNVTQLPPTTTPKAQ